MSVNLTAGWAAVGLNAVALLCGAAFLVGSLSAAVDCLGRQRAAPENVTPVTLFEQECPTDSEPEISGDRPLGQTPTRAFVRCVPAGGGRP